MKTFTNRLLLIIGVVALVAAACSSGEQSADTTATSSTTSTTAAAPTSSTTTSTTEAPSEPTLLPLAPVVIEDDDPNLTIEHLESVMVHMVDGFLVVTFDSPQFAMNANVRDVSGNSVDCGRGNDGESRCDIFFADGSFVGEVYDLGDIVLTDNQIALPATVSGPQGSITIPVEGTDYSSQNIRFMDGPLFVQIDPNSGGIAEPVTRRLGDATGAELAAAIG